MRQPFSPSYLLVTVGNAVAGLGSAGGVEWPHNLTTALPLIRSFNDMEVQAIQCSILQYLLLHVLDVKISKELLCCR